MNRGRRREKIFSSNQDYIAFIEVLKETTSLWNINVCAYCLIPNHYHILVHTPEGNISRCMRHINGVYTQRYNRANKHDGSLFRGRYKSIIIESDVYLTVLVRYIHRNPLRARMVDRLEDYTWSSHNGYLSRSSSWDWLYKEAFFELLTNVKSNRLKEYREFVGEEDLDEIVGIFSRKKTPSVLGTEKFKDFVNEKYSENLLQEEIPETKVLVSGKEKIKESVCRVFGVDIRSLYGVHRGVTNEARNVAIYLTRLLRRDSLKEIGKEFKISSYSSVSSIIEKMKIDVVNNKKIKKQVQKARKSLR